MASFMKSKFIISTFAASLVMDEPPGKKHKIAKAYSRDDSASETRSIGKKDKRKGRKKRQKRGTHVITKPQWTPQDDYLLINSVVQLCDLLEVYEQVKFSKKYALKDIEHRWKDLMNSESRTYVALEAIGKLAELEKFSLDRYIPFNEAERNLISKVQYKDVYATPNSLPSLEPFKNLLQERRQEFFRSRIPKDLFKCWSIMRKYGLIYPDPLTTEEAKNFNLEEIEFRMICGRDKPYLPPDRTVLSVSSPKPSEDDVISHTSEEVLQVLLLEKQKHRKRLLRRLRCAAEEAHRWTQAVDRVLNFPISDFQPSSVFATLLGQVTRFLIKSRQTSFGRAAEGIQPDIDLSCESYSQRISRIHGYIYLNEEDIFFIGNVAQRPIFVNGTPLFKDEEMILPDDSMIMIERISLRFNINKCSVRDMKPLFPTSASQLAVRSCIPLVFGPTPNAMSSGAASSKAQNHHSSRSAATSSMLKRSNSLISQRPASTSVANRQSSALNKSNPGNSAAFSSRKSTQGSLNNSGNSQTMYSAMIPAQADPTTPTIFSPMSSFSENDFLRSKSMMESGSAPPRPRLPSQSENSRRKQRLI